MSDTTKRLDLQFGSFACSVQGFDDPVQPVQQVLQALQNLLEETPGAGNLGIAFDAAEIDRLIGEVARRADLDEDNVEIVPGLIIVHHGNRAAAGELAGEQADEGDADIDGGEAWSRPFIAGNDADGDAAQAEDTGGTETGDDAEPGYVNIFTPAAPAGSESVAQDGSLPEMDETTPDDDSFASRLRRIGTEARPGEPDVGETDPYAGPDEAREDVHEDIPAKDIFADPGENTDGSIFANPMSTDIMAEPVDDDEPLNLFANSADAESGADEPRDEITAEADILNLAVSRNIFANHGSEDAGLQDHAAQPDDADTGQDGAGQADLGSEVSERGEALFGTSENQPEIEETDEGYTASGLAKAAEATTVAELMVCAAAWMVLIQGQTTFTRHDVIDVFETIPGEHSKTLEARFKGFGKAVRNEQLIMIEDGVFGLARTELDRFQSLL